MRLNIQARMSTLKMISSMEVAWKVMIQIPFVTPLLNQILLSSMAQSHHKEVQVPDEMRMLTDLHPMLNRGRIPLHLFELISKWS
jgi:hypothetical protein